MPIMGETKNFRKRPLQFMREHSITPPSDREMRQFNFIENGNRIVRYDPGFKNVGSIATDGMFSRFYDDKKIVDSDRMETGTFQRADVTTPVGYMKLVPDPRNVGAFTFQVKNDPVHDLLPIWFLPWASDRVVQMQIPERPRRHDTDNDPSSPDIFFTAAINGCSVFVKGGCRSPVIAHAGTENGTPYGGDAAGFWRALFAVSEMHYGGSTSRFTGEVNNTMYVNDTGISKQLHTTNAERYKTWLDGVVRNGTRIKEVKPYGCVFGIRYGRLWSFYLQENAVVTKCRVVQQTKQFTERRLKSKHLFGAIKIYHDVTVDRQVQVEVESIITKPIRVSPFYPQGDGAQTFTTQFHAV